LATARQFLDRTRSRIAGQQQVQHRHEVALAGTEAAMQIGGLALPCRQRRLYEVQRVVERLRQLRRDDVIAKRFLGRPHPLGQLEDKVPLVHPLRD
jgi:hypothetical protein